jgi:hypothetical protein
MDTTAKVTLQIYDKYIYIGHVDFMLFVCIVDSTDCGNQETSLTLKDETQTALFKDTVPTAQ